MEYEIKKIGTLSNGGIHVEFEYELEGKLKHEEMNLGPDLRKNDEWKTYIEKHIQRVLDLKKAEKVPGGTNLETFVGKHEILCHEVPLPKPEKKPKITGKDLKDKGE